MLDQYINSGLKDEQNSLQSLMTYLQIEDVSTAEGSPHNSKENEEALELVMTLMAQNSKVNLRRDIPHIVNDESILNLQKEVLEYDRKIVYIQKELECKQEVDDRYAKTSANLEDLYFKIKTAWWAHKLTIDIDSFKDPKFSLKIGYKDKFHFKIYLKSKGKNISAFRYDLMGIEVLKWIPEYEDMVREYIEDAERENDFLVFLRQLGDVIWMHTRDLNN